MGLRQKLVVVLVVIVFVSLSLFWVFTSWYTENLLTTSKLASARDTADYYEASLLSWIESKKNRVLDFASDGFIRETFEKVNQNHDRLKEYLHTAKYPLDSEILAIEIVDAQGTIIVSDHEDLMDTTALPSLLRQMKPGEAHLLDVKHTGSRAGLDIIAPITKREDNRIIGFLLVHYRLWSIQDVFSGKKVLNFGATTTIKPTSSLRLSLIDERGATLFSYHSSTHEKFTTSRVKSEVVKNWLEQGKEIAQMSPDEEGRFVFVSSMIMKMEANWSWLLVVEQDASEGLAIISHMKRVLILVGLVTLGLAALIAWVVARSIVRPLLDLTKAAESISKGKMDVRLSIRSTDEIGKLTQSFERMATAIKILREDRQ